MHRSRLEAEQVHDALVQISGSADLAMGGKSVRQFIQTPGIHVTPNVDYQGFDVDRPGAMPWWWYTGPSDTTHQYILQANQDYPNDPSLIPNFSNPINLDMSKIYPGGESTGVGGISEFISGDFRSISAKQFDRATEVIR